jgi:catechol 2,3-dioxygenase-like lactoylglutathione lyase family enzyme
MRILGIGWLGSRTAAYEAMTGFTVDILGLTPAFRTDDMAVFRLPDGDEFQLFGPDNDNLPFADQPVAAFLVDDVPAARAEMEARGVAFIGETAISGDAAWAYFRAPDGRVYELTHRKDAGETRGDL